MPACYSPECFLSLDQNVTLKPEILEMKYGEGLEWQRRETVVTKTTRLSVTG